jgi:hypothetical protein
MSSLAEIPPFLGIILLIGGVSTVATAILGGVGVRDRWLFLLIVPSLIAFIVGISVVWVVTPVWFIGLEFANIVFMGWAARQVIKHVP